MEVNHASGSIVKQSTLMCVKYIVSIVKHLILSLVTITAAICKSILPSTEKSVRGQIVLITGAGSGIGRELALQCADLGCTVVCVDSDTTSNKETVSQVNHRVQCQRSLEENSSAGYFSESRNKKNAAFDYTCDIYNQHAVMSMTRRVEEDLGRIDILINNIFRPELSRLNTNVEGLVDVVTMNMISNFWTVLAVLPSMIARKYGHVVAISSTTDVCSSVDQPPCSAAQFAVAGLLESINQDLQLEENNICVTCVHPYAIITANTVDASDTRLYELSPEFAASEIIRAIRQNMTTLTIPRNLLFWINVFRTIPQDTRHTWQNMFLPHSHRS